MVSVFQSFLSQDAVEERENQARALTAQGDDWKADHATGLTANKQTFVQTLGQERESAVIASAGGGRSNEAGTIPIKLQEHDGEKLAMQNSQQGTFAQVLQGNSVMQADDERESVAGVDANLEQEIKDRAPIVSAFAAQGDMTKIQAMLNGLPGADPVAIQPGTPQVNTGMPGMPGSTTPQATNKFTMSV